ncbi:hypothetical protein Tco_1011069 [Tanacetum coccineum]
MMPKYDNEELTINLTQVFSVHNWTLKPNQPKELPFSDHMKAICNLDVSVDSKASKHSSQTEEVPQGKKPGAKSELRRKQSLKHTSESKTEASKSKTSQSKKDTQSISAKDKSPSHPSPPTPVDMMLQQNPQLKLILEILLLMIPYLHNRPELSKLLASHNFASCLPTELKELPSKFTELSGEIKEPKHHVKDIEIELPGDLKEIPTKLETFTSTISSLTSQVAELNIQWELPSEFAIMVENASGATTKDVPSAGQANASPTEGEKNTKDAETNLKNELVDLLGIKVVEQYHNKKLLFDKYCDKMLKRRKSSKIINFSDLHLAEWREVVPACPDKKLKGWKPINDKYKNGIP